MNEKYKAIIIDDEPYAVDVLTMLLKKTSSYDVEIIGSTIESIEGVHLINELQPDIVFLDIEMPRLNGFQLLDQVSNLQSHLIFTTAYDQYAVKAFRYSAVDYLMKPINAKELTEAIAKLPSKDKLDKSHVNAAKDIMQEILESNIPKLIIIPTMKGYIFQKIKSIIYCEAKGACTKFFVDDKPAYTASKGLSTIEDLLAEAHFFRAHRQYLVNTKEILELIREDSCWLLLMNNGDKIPLARERRDDFLNLMGG